MGFKILKPTTVQPQKAISFKYEEIYKEVLSLSDGQWLPVQCDSHEQINRLVSSMYYHNKHSSSKVQVTRRGLSAYLRQKKR